MKRTMFCVVLLMSVVLLLAACSESRDVITITPATNPATYTYEVGISYDDTIPDPTPEPTANPETYETDPDAPDANTDPETTPEPHPPATYEAAAPDDTELAITPEPSTDNTQTGFNIADFEGTWTNSINETLTFPMPGFEIGEIWLTPNGAHIVEMIWQEGPGEMRVWLFPVGVEMIRYNLLGERMYNQKVVSDTSRARLFQGDFEVTSCCPDDKINETLFIR